MNTEGAAEPGVESEEEPNCEGTNGKEPLVEAPLGTPPARPPALPQEGPPADVAGSPRAVTEGDDTELQRPESESASLPAAMHTEPAVNAPGSVTFQRLELILERLEESCRGSDDAAHFLRRRAEIEEVYAKSLRRLYEETAEAKVACIRRSISTLFSGILSVVPYDVLTVCPIRSCPFVRSGTSSRAALRAAKAEAG
jgi:hypothetical protein